MSRLLGSGIELSDQRGAQEDQSNRSRKATGGAKQIPDTSYPLLHMLSLFKVMCGVRAGRRSRGFLSRSLYVMTCPRQNTSLPT